MQNDSSEITKKVDYAERKYRDNPYNDFWELWFTCGVWFGKEVHRNGELSLPGIEDNPSTYNINIIKDGLGLAFI